MLELSATIFFSLASILVAVQIFGAVRLFYTFLR